MRCILVLTMSAGLLAGTLGSERACRAVTISFTSDASFVAYQASAPFVKTFGGNVRWGSGTASGDWEYAIVNGSDIPIGAVGQTAWTDPAPNLHDVTFSYDGGGNSTLALSSIGSMTRTVPLGPTALFVRVRDSESPLTSLSTIEVDLTYNGVGVDYSFSLLTGDSNAEYWGVLDPNLSLGFVVTADAALQGPKTAGSDPMYQFKVGTAPVPEPGGLALAAVGLAVLGAARRLHGWLRRLS